MSPELVKMLADRGITPEMHGGDSAKALSLLSAANDREREARIAAERKASGIADKLTLRVGKSGTLSVYGLGRFPVSLYQEQWERLFQNREAIAKFIAANQATLKRKGDATAEVEKTA